MPVNIGQPSHGRFTKWHEAPVARAVFGVNNLHPRNMPAGAFNDSFGCLTCICGRNQSCMRGVGPHAVMVGLNRRPPA